MAAEHYLVTGGAGFIGSHIAEQLLQRGARVRIMDDFSTGHRRNVDPLAAAYPGALEIFRGDIVRLEDCRRAVTGMEYVIHQAALASVPRSLADPLGTHQVNATGTLQLLIAARDAGVRRFVYAGSSSVYGNAPELPKTESQPTHPLSPYALAKLAGEEYARLFHDHFGLSTVTLRYFNVFGPRQDPDSPYAAVIPIFVGRLLRGEPPEIHGDGTQTRDFTYVANVVEANLAACRAPGAAGVYNVACGTRIELRELLAQIQRILGTNLKPIFTPPRPGDVHDSLADIARARRELGYVPAVGMAEGLIPTVAYFRELQRPRTP